MSEFSDLFTSIRALEANVEANIELKTVAQPAELSTVRDLLNVSLNPALDLAMISSRLPTRTARKEKTNQSLSFILSSGLLNFRRRWIVQYGHYECRLYDG